MEEINIAVLGSPQVGKSTFIQRAFDLRSLPDSPFTSRKMSIDGNVYVVRLVELTHDDLDLDEHKRICWPDNVDGSPVPVIDGAFTLYDVLNRDSLGQIPETLSKWLALSHPRTIFVWPSQILNLFCSRRNLQCVDPVYPRGLQMRRSTIQTTGRPGGR